MNNVKTIFSIKDIENLTGIKAHTIRIWEKRYNILEPLRTDTNIRYYDIKCIQKILNITLLNKHGYKISHIAQLPESEIPELVNNIISDKSVNTHAISAFKMAMMNFDQALFLNTYDTLLTEKTFQEIFFSIFIPLIEEIGYLWQTNTITIAHEHFITNLIKQKILVKSEAVQKIEPVHPDKLFVLFLPENEIHELGLLYLNFHIQNEGYQTLFLGLSLPITDLKEIKKHFNNITFICYMTVEPVASKVNEYIKLVEKEILTDESEFWIIGRMVQFIKDENLNKKFHLFNRMDTLISHI
jgi:DNA-binding transcriptional MerR regulator